MAEEIGATPPIVYRWERGRTSPYLETVDRVAAALGSTGLYMVARVNIAHPVPLAEAFPQQLRALRESRAMTWSGLAMETGDCGSYIKALEEGTCRPTLRTVTKLAGRLQVDPRRLLLPPREKETGRQ